MNTRNGMRPVHPGDILREEIETLGLSAEPGQGLGAASLLDPLASQKVLL